MLTNLDRWSKEIGIVLTDEQIERMRRFWELVLETNRHTNLTRITDDDDATLKHFVDSLTVLNTGTIGDKARVIDIGTGAGFPGIPLKIVRPDIRLTLLDSTLKRVRFLQGVIEEMGWDDVQAIHGRAEQYAKGTGLTGAFDVAVARAVARLPRLVSFCMPYVRRSGHFVAMKGPEVEDEVKESATAFAEIGAKVVKVQRLDLPEDAGRRSLIIIQRTR